jgi:hypothetical protein
MSSIKGRTDIEAAELRTLTEAQLARLNFKSDAAKSLPQQITKIQQVISKKSAALNDANSKVASLTAQLEEASTRASSLHVAVDDLQSKLQSLLTQCAGAAPVAARTSLTDEQNKHVQTMHQFGSLLPPELANGFNEAMRHIMQLMNVQAQVIHVDSHVESPMTAASDGYGYSTPEPTATAVDSPTPGSSEANLGDSSRASEASAWSRARRGRSPRSQRGAALDSNLFGESSEVRSRSHGLSPNSAASSCSVRRRLRGKQAVSAHSAFRPLSANSASHGEQPSGPRYFSSEALPPSSAETKEDA